MKTAYLLSRIWAWACVGFFFLTLASFMRHAPALIAQQAGVTRESLDTRIALESYQARLLLDNKARDLMRRIDTFAAISEQAVRLADTHAGEAIQAVDQNAEGLQGMLAEQLTRTNDSIAEIARLRSDLQPAVQGANYLMRRDGLPRELEAATRDARIVLAEIGRTSIDLRHAVPGFLASATQITQHVELATLAAAHTSEDTDLMIKRITPPLLPRWARLALAIGVPVAQGGAATATLCVTLGHCR
jgi:hypothetical protein